MTKVRIMKIVGFVLVFVFATNAAFAFAASHHLTNFAKIHHTSKKRASNLTSDDPDPDSDFKAAFYPVRHHIKRQYNSISAMITVPPILDPLINDGIVPIKTSHPSLNNLSDIFIPPKNRT